jgi:hypothetical protein
LAGILETTLNIAPSFPVSGSNGRYEQIDRQRLAVDTEFPLSRPPGSRICDGQSVVADEFSETVCKLSTSRHKHI